MKHKPRFPAVALAGLAMLATMPATAKAPVKLDCDLLWTYYRDYWAQCVKAGDCPSKSPDDVVIIEGPIGPGTDGKEVLTMTSTDGGWITNGGVKLPGDIFNRLSKPQLEQFRLSSEAIRDLLEDDRRKAEALRGSGALSAPAYDSKMSKYKDGMQSYKSNMQVYKGVSQ